MIKPYNNTDSKKSEVRAMFNSIARNYDLLNRLLSFRIDVVWRKKLVRELGKYTPKRVLDIASGTGDLAIMINKLNPEKIVGLDLSEKMLEIGRKKVKRKRLEHIIELVEGDAEHLQFDTGFFDAVTVAFGVRNFENLEVGLKEALRVLKSGAPFFILEFSTPKNWLFRWGYNLYSKYYLPIIGKIISKDSAAYTYLPASIKEFPCGTSMIQILDGCGFENCSYKNMSGGIATLYCAHKPS